MVKLVNMDPDQNNVPLLQWKYIPILLIGTTSLQKGLTIPYGVTQVKYITSLPWHVLFVLRLGSSLSSLPLPQTIPFKHGSMHWIAHYPCE